MKFKVAEEEVRRFFKVIAVDYNINSKLFICDSQNSFE